MAMMRSTGLLGVRLARHGSDARAVELGGVWADGLHGNGHAAAVVIGDGGGGDHVSEHHPYDGDGVDGANLVAAMPAAGSGAAWCP